MDWDFEVWALPAAALLTTLVAPAALAQSPLPESSTETVAEPALEAAGGTPTETPPPAAEQVTAPATEPTTEPTTALIAEPARSAPQAAPAAAKPLAPAQARAGSAAPPAHCIARDNAACQPCKTDERQASCCDPDQDPLCVDQTLRGIGVPIPIYNPQLDFALGAMGMVTYHPFKQDKVSPPWATMLFGMYSTNGSWLVMANQEAFWGEDDNRAGFLVGGGKFNSDFYGTGDMTSSGIAFPLGSAMFIVQPKYLRRVWHRLYVGARYRLLWNEAVLSAPDDGDPETPPAFVPIDSELLHSGVGLLAEFDTRDNRFSPTRGFYAPLGSMFYSEAFGGDANFANMDLAVNYYHSWFQKRLILASRGYLNLATSDTPDHLKPAVGAGPDLRGYAYGRYRDNLFMAAQAELRWYFWWKFGAVAFGGIGTTAAGLDRLGEGSVLPSYGIGLRFLAFEAQRLVVRVDYGRGDEDGQIYFSVSEAF